MSFTCLTANTFRILVIMRGCRIVLDNFFGYIHVHQIHAVQTPLLHPSPGFRAVLTDFIMSSHSEVHLAPIYISFPFFLKIAWVTWDRSPVRKKKICSDCLHQCFLVSELWISAMQNVIYNFTLKCCVWIQADT